MVIASVLGGLVGIEREWSNHAAGLRTHILVCLGSATIMLMSIYGFSDFVYEANVRIDPARLAAQVISGIGFLGAGAILRNGNIIKGLTTAASIWVVAAIGLCVGAGFIIGAIVCTFLVLINLYFLNKWEKHMHRRKKIDQVDIMIKDDPGAMGRVIAILEQQDIVISNLKITSVEKIGLGDRDNLNMHLTFSLKSQKKKNVLAALEELLSLDSVISLEARNPESFESNEVLRNNGGKMTI
ncbi:MgtC/SapB family protein [Cohnella silvisoli]|nr:MgtC/SapB family protein [Cohnella silvisoli]